MIKLKLYTLYKYYYCILITKIKSKWRSAVKIPWAENKQLSKASYAYLARLIRPGSVRMNASRNHKKKT